MLWSRSLLLSRAVARSFWRRAALFLGVFFILGGIGRPRNDEKQIKKERRPFSKEDERQGNVLKEDEKQGYVLSPREMKRGR